MYLCFFTVFNLNFQFILFRLYFTTISVHAYWEIKQKKITKTKANPALVPHHRNLEKQSVEDRVSKAQEGWGLWSDMPEVQKKLQGSQGWEGLEAPWTKEAFSDAPGGGGLKLRMAIAIQKSPSSIKTYQQPRESSFPGSSNQLSLKSAALCPIVGLKWVPRCVWRSGYPPSPAHTRPPPPEKWHRRQFGKNAGMISWFHICVSRVLPTSLLKRILRFYKNRSPPSKNKQNPPKSLQCSLLVFKQM